MISDEAKELRNAYQKAWRKRNPEKMKEYMNSYWERKAAAYTPEVRARELHELGYTQREIADALNMSLGSVNKILNKA